MILTACTSYVIYRLAQSNGYFNQMYPVKTKVNYYWIGEIEMHSDKGMLEKGSEIQSYFGHLSK